ncbi:MAG TPA: hypothetical protein VES91_08640 [Burkholderiaceae bacterium]|nr:hypothetical protein [Burkholderiaceae bacterium]
MYRTSHPIRILSATLAVVFGLGLVATAGGALSEERATPTRAGLQLVKLEPVVIKPHQSRVAAACEQAPKAAL